MTDAGSSPTQPNVSALVEALDQRARQAGSEGATNVLRGMVGSLAEALGSIEARLDRIEDSLEGQGDADGGAVLEQVQAGIAAFNARLGRLEEAFVAAVEDSGSGTQSVVEQFRRSVEDTIRGHLQAPPPVDLSPIERRLAELGSRLESLPMPPVMEPVDLGGLERRLDDVAARLSSVSQPVMEPVDLTPLERRLEQLGTAVDQSTIERRLDELAARLESLPQPPAVDLGPVQERLDALAQRIDSLPQPAPPVDLTPIERRFDELPPPAPAVDLGPVQERLDALAQRIDSLPQPPPPVDLADVHRHLDDVTRRIDELPQPPPPVDLTPIERRFDELPPPAPAVDLGPVHERLDALAQRIDSLPQPPPPVDLADVHRHLDDVTRRIDELPRPEPVPNFEPVERHLHELRQQLAAIAESADSMPKLHQRLDGIEQRLQPPEPVDLAPIHAALDDLRSRIRSLVDRPEVQPAPPVDLGPVQADLAQVRGVLDHFQHWSGEFLHRIEQRLDQLETAVQSRSGGDSDTLAAIERTNEQLRARVASLLGAQSAEVQRRVQQVDEQLAAQTRTLDELRTELSQRPTGNDLREAFSDAVRREAELLTQRVASLTVLLESTRALLDEHVDDTANSLGRKASEVGRRLAADFGLRGKRSSGRPDPRELGRGGH